MLPLLAHLVNLVVVAVLLGNEFGTWAVVHRAVAQVSVPEQVRAEQVLTRLYGQLMPVLMIAALASGGLVLATLPAGPGSLPWTSTLAAVACLAAMLAITLVGNQPINQATLQQNPDGAPAAWLALRGRWNRLHNWRVLLDLAAFVLFALGVVLQP
jgi:uncharacterized membrane protein